MAGDWIKMRREIASDPDVVEIAAKAGIDEFGVVGRLHAVWSWLDQHSDDGSNVRIVSAFLDRLTACPGFAEAMRAVGWLSGRDGSLTFPGYSEHNGETAKARGATQKRVQLHRKKQASVTNVTSAPLPEKRREEKKEKVPAGGEPAAPKVRKEADGDHAEFIRRWMEEYPKHHNGEAYVFQGAKDGAQVSNLLKSCKKTPEEWQRWFVAAWKHPELFNCKAAAAISGFVSRFNEIRDELKALKPAMPSADYLKTEWPSWLSAQGQPFVEYQFAADFLKSDFHKARKVKA